MHQSKLPRENLHATVDYDAAYWGRQRFDYAISVSLWSHLPLSEIERCLVAMQPGMRPAGQYFTSIFVCREHCSKSQKRLDGIVSFPDRDPYHHNTASIAEVARRLDIRFEFIGNWSHPRGQEMLKFTF